MLTPRQLAVHLVKRGLLPSDALVDGELTLEVTPGRNYNHRITTRRGPNFLAKQSRDLSATLSTEAGVYRLLQQDRGEARVARYLPRLRLFDRRHQLLLLDLLVGCHTMASHFRSHGRIHRAIGASLGRAVGTLHCSEIGRRLRPIDLPWVLLLPRPPIELLREISAANLQMIRMLQESTSLCRGMDELAASWRDGWLIHNDLRWENCLLSKSGKADWRLKLVDWELAGSGDPDWDLGAVFSNFLAVWIFSMDFVAGSTPVLLARSARHQLARMRPAIGAFWSAYIASRAMSTTAALECLVRATRFAAARLVQLAYERQQKSTDVTGNIVCLVQMCANVMLRPEVACAELLGLKSSRR